MRGKVWTGKEWEVVEGRKLRDWPQGVTMEDARGVVHYLTKERVVDAPALSLPMLSLPGM